MPTLASTPHNIGTLKIHTFPSKAAFDAAVNGSLIGPSDISYVLGDPDSFPTYSSSDAGKALMVDSNGQLYWGAAGGGLIAQ